MLQRLASPFARETNFDAVGTIKTVEGGKLDIVPQELITPLKMKSKTIRDQSYGSNTSISLQKTLNTIAASDKNMKESNSRTVIPYMGKNKSALPEDISRDISQIHMYDTMILGKEPSPGPKPRYKSTIRRNLMEKMSMSKPKNISNDIHSVMPKVDFFGSDKNQVSNNKITMRSINTSQLSPRAKQLITDTSEQDAAQSEFGSSSAFSRDHVQTLMIGHQ
jgi:hypothetical protein